MCLTHLCWLCMMIWLINGNNRNAACLCQWLVRINKLLEDRPANGTKFVWQQIIGASPRLLRKPDASNEYSCDGEQMPCVQGQRMCLFLQHGKFDPRWQWPDRNWRWWWVIGWTSASAWPCDHQLMEPVMVPTQRWGGADGSCSFCVCYKSHCSVHFWHPQIKENLEIWWFLPPQKA